MVSNSVCMVPPDPGGAGMSANGRSPGRVTSEPSK